MIEQILSRTHDRGFRDYLAKLLVEICRIDTTPKSDVALMRTAEAQVFDILERELDSFGFAGAHRERRPVNPAISRHPAYSQLHFTKTPERPAGLTPEETYAGRGNLLYMLPGSNRQNAGENIAINAHIDIVAPFFPPRLDRGVVHGRGACDDKGNVVAIIGALKVLADILNLAKRPLNRNLTAMFVIEEETGGNGSLSLALDRELKKLYDSIVVLECTDNCLHPANRGAVWYRAELRAPAGLSDFEMAAFAIEELEKEGRAIKAESRHNLFPQRPVQTCHGIIGHVGEHPSRICGRVGFTVNFSQPPAPAAETMIRDIIEFALADYIGLYGDKTKANDPVSGKPKVESHYTFKAGPAGFEVEVFGATGHMGSILENDGAITKMMHMVRGLSRCRAKLETVAAGSFKLELAGRRAGETSLVLEGGQGFVPTHPIKEIMSRVARAAEIGAENYCRLAGRPLQAAAAGNLATVTYDKLHNDAFDGDPDSPAMRNAIFAAQAAGVWKDAPVAGWTVSCDSRIFAGEYPGMPVITTGAGFLAHAHADAEQLNIESLTRSVELLAVYILRQTGTFE